MLAGNAGAYSGSLLALPPNITQGLERLAMDERSSLLQKYVTYGRKRFHNIGPDEAGLEADGRKERIGSRM